MIEKEKNFISLVIYINNSQDYIGSFMDTICPLIKEKFEKYELIFVDDASTDKSLQIIKDIAQKEEYNVSIIKMGHFQGIELSMNAGVDYSIGDYVYQFDSIEINYDISLVIAAYNKILEGNDIVFVSPNKENSSSSKYFYKIFNAFSGYDKKIKTVSFLLITRRGINKVESTSKKIYYRKATYIHSGLKVHQEIYKSNNKKNNKKSKSEIGMRKDLAMDSLILFTDVIYKITLFIAIFMMLTTLGSIVYTISVYFTKQVIEGYTTTMLLLSFGFFSVFLIFAFIIKYLSIIINLIFQKSRYDVQSIERITGKENDKE